MMSEMGSQGISVPRIGVVFQGLSVFGSGSALQYQQAVLSPIASIFGRIGHWCGRQGMGKVIISDSDGIINDGELLLVLGRPGSGCITLLNTLCSQTRGVTLSKDSNISHSGVTLQQMF